MRKLTPFAFGFFFPMVGVAAAGLVHASAPSDWMLFPKWILETVGGLSGYVVAMEILASVDSIHERRGSK